MRGRNNNRTTNEESWLDGEAGTREHQLIIDGREASPREYARVMAAQPYQWSEEEVQAAQEKNVSWPFRLFR